MSKGDKLTHMPKLRFPEFRESGSWEKKQIKELFNLDESAEKANSFDNDKLLTVKLHGLGVVKNEKTGTLTGGANYFQRKAGQFIFSKIDLLNGAFGLIPKELHDFHSSSDIPALTFKKYEGADFFLKWMLANYKTLSIERTGTSSTLKRVSKEDFLDTWIWLPKIAEQQKIAKCLSSLDELIASESSKFDALKIHKKGLMRALFPPEDGDVPKLRFPEFINNGNWRKKSLGDVTYSVSERNKAGKKLPIYSINNVEGFLPQSNQFEGMDSHSRGYDVSLYKLIGKNTFAYNPARINVGSIGFSGDLDNVIVSSLYVCFKAAEQLDNKFLFYFLKSETFNECVRKSVEGGIRSYLFYENFAKINIQFPDTTEQQIIADCLSSLDALITAQAEKLKTLKLHKKGLMQGLFTQMID